ncbi:MAG: MAPEG family protein [Pseudomonadota bacterium]
MTDPITGASPEIFWLAATALATALMWVPHILWLVGHKGLFGALMDGEHDIDYTAPWAARAHRAHLNAIENLAVFAAAVLAVELAGANSAATATAAGAFFFVRVAHFAVYCAGLPLVRTVLFFVGVACQVALALAAISAA